MIYVGPFEWKLFLHCSGVSDNVWESIPWYIKFHYINPNNGHKKNQDANYKKQEILTL